MDFKFSNKTVEAAFALAVAGGAESQVGDLEGYGKAWQGLVKLERSALLRHNVNDRHYGYVKAGTTTLVWLADDNGTIVCHRSEDCDTKGARFRMEDMRMSFAAMVRRYNVPVDMTVFNATLTEDFSFDSEASA